MTILVFDYSGRLARLNATLADLGKQVDAVRMENERIRTNLARSEFAVVSGLSFRDEQPIEER